jgi:hypothetical protein
MNSLYVAWQEPQTRTWLVVGELTYHRDKHVYQFAYTKGAKKSPNFVPFARMTDLYKPYFATELFPVFANRLLSKSRPEYQAYLQWLNVPNTEQDNLLLLLARSSGKRATDSLEVFPSHERHADGIEEFYFFSRELRHLPTETLDRINHLPPDEPLLLVPEPQNEPVAYAIALQTDNSVKVGYCPPYLAKPLWRWVEHQIRLTVAKVNREAPLQLRLLCRWAFNLPEDFQPFLDEEFERL